MNSLTLQLIKRQLEQRYRGSVLGVLWSFLTPLAMLAVFTFVFAVVLQARWAGSTASSTLEFAIILFAGLITFNLFAEVVQPAPGLIVSQPNLVKKVVFPLEILPVVAVGAALVQAGIAYSLLMALQIGFGSGFHPAALLAPILVIPLVLFTLGLSWFLAALGVYVRDVGQIIPPLVTALMFLTPVFYPATTLPEWIRPILAYNPLAFSVEGVRDAVVFGRFPDIVTWLLGLAGGLCVAALGYAFFQKTRKGFSDVL
jgi:lipopolysaccharide transport system permease protein